MHPDIFKEFRINVKRCYKFRGMYMCETSKGTKVIHISAYTPVQITLEHNIKEHLIKKGFTCLNRLHISSKDTPYVIYNNRVYLMMDWNDGQVADFYNIGDIKSSVQVLAKMHIAGRGFNNLPKGINLSQIKNIGDTYEKRHKETVKLKRRIENTGRKTDFEVLYLKNSSIYSEYQEVSKELIDYKSYQKLINLADKDQSLAHHKFTYHNIITKANQRPVITGFEKCGYDVQITDLAYLARRIMERNRWDINLLISIIEEYNKLIPLSDQEWRAIKGMMIFPERFAKLCNEYYHSKRRWNYNMFHRKFTKILGYKDDYITCVEEIKKY